MVTPQPSRQPPRIPRRKLRRTRAIIPLNPPRRAGGLPDLPLPQDDGIKATRVLINAFTNAGVGSARWARLAMLDALPYGLRLEIKQNDKLDKAFNTLYHRGLDYKEIVRKLRGLNRVAAKNLADL